MSKSTGNAAQQPAVRMRRGMSTGQRRQEIVDRAAELFDDAGYASTTMEDIARTVGIAKPTLYHYFQSKDEILFWIHEGFIDPLIDRQRMRGEAGLSAEQQLMEVMADILELMETHRGHVRVFFEHHRELPAQQQETIRIKRDSYEHMVQDILRRGIEEGSFRDVDTQLTAFALFGMCNWAYQWYGVGGRLRTRDIALQFFAIFVNGIGRRGALLTDP
jgi:TetR/AcrR family transcriptional regulator, cholesterol catabolism regulator